MSVARFLDWRKTRARAEALLTHEQYLTIVRARAARRLKQQDQEWHEQPPELPAPLQEQPAPQVDVPSPDETDAELSARFRDAPKGATEWPGLRSEYDQKSGRAEFLGAPIKLQVQEGKTPAARGEQVTIENPVRIYATQYWLSPDGGGVMLPGFHEKFGVAPVFAKTPDGRLHLMDGHHTLFDHLRNGGGALSGFVFDVPIVSFQDGNQPREDKKSWREKINERFDDMLRAVARAKAERTKFDPNQPRDEQGRFADGGGDGGGTEKPESGGKLGPRPQVSAGKNVSDQAAAKARIAVLSIPKAHREALKDVPVNVVSLTKEISGLGTAAGMYSYLPLEFGGGGKQIQVAENAGWDEKHSRPLKSIERTTVHELGHAFDHHNDWKHGKDVVQDAMKGLERLNTIERNDSAYFFTNTRETFAELYAVAHSPDKSAKYFGGLSLDRANTVFAEALEKVRAL